MHARKRIYTILAVLLTGIVGVCVALYTFVAKAAATTNACEVPNEQKRSSHTKAQNTNKHLFISCGGFLD